VITLLYQYIRFWQQWKPRIDIRHIPASEERPTNPQSLMFLSRRMVLKKNDSTYLGILGQAFVL